jgi:RNA polymerase sigma factor (sigma-70 family)
VTTQQHIRIDIPQGVLNGRTTAGKTTSDQTLIERIAVGDKLAMRVLFARHHVRVYRFVVRLVRDETLAEDVVGEMFLDVWRQAATFKARAAVSTWLLAIARFKALSLLRRKGEEVRDEEATRAIEDPADDPEVAVRKKERSEILRRCWSKLFARTSGYHRSRLLSGESDQRGRRHRRHPREYREDAHVLRAKASVGVTQVRRPGSSLIAETTRCVMRVTPVSR